MSVISAGTTTTTAFKVTGDTTGTLQLQTGAVPTTAIDISATQVVTFPATTTLDFTGTLLLGDGSAAAPTLAHSGDTNTGIYFPGADQVAITTAGTQRVYVGATGDVGIGTGSPGAQLEVSKSATNAYTTIRWSNTGTSGRAYEIGVGGNATPAGFANSLYFYDATAASLRMVVASSGNVGIGTASPNKTGFDTNGRVITVYGPQRGVIELGSDSAINNDQCGNVSFMSGTTQKGQIRCQLDGSGNGNLTFFANDTTERMRIANSGDVGIGTNNPTARLNVAGVGAANNPAFAVDVSTSSTFVHAQENFAANITSGQTALIVLGREGSTKNSGYLGYRYSGTPGSNDNLLTLGHWAADNLVNLNGAGNLMIGGTTVLQSAILSAYGSIAARNGGVDGTYANAFIAQYNQNNNEHNVIQTAVSGSGPNSGFRFRASDGAGSATTTTVLDVTRAQTVFYTSGAERARFASTGVLLLNNTETSGSAAGQIRSYFSAASYTTPFDNNLPCIQLWNTNNGSANAHAILLLRTGGSAGGDPFISFDVANEFGWSAGMLNSDNSFRIVSGWNTLTGTGVFITANGSSWSSTSDERVKDIIEPITNAVSKVSSLRAVIGKYKKDSPDKRRSFLIAQDVDKVLPEAVDKNNEGGWGLSYTDTIPLLVAAIKELSAKVAALESK